MSYRNPDNWPVDEYTVKTVENNKYDNGGFSVTSTDGWTFGVTAEEAKGKPLPEPGQDIILLGGFGHMLRGIFINDVEYRYVTKEQADKERVERLASYAREKEERFYASIRDWIERKDAMDKPFRDRMDRFANKGFKEFWQEDGGYELLCVEQANLLLRHAATQSDDVLEWLDNFYDLPYAQQEQAFPELDKGHSGNTFGAMVGLAKAVARGDDI